ncbi:hypothetical protein [Actinoplanes sp. L3-i22]|uniref:hypothetical protein n=1 Tax=Actinoplanes sp. L3-i22 TaxID=2836373 RepID=UPI001C745356|nr:hypothetical protein [Actinoplanes sp. L3-i22]BCY09780.1 hypothetical protein L3i22_048680 [Actinoplanes sp. L3-i22]
MSATASVMHRISAAALVLGSYELFLLTLPRETAVAVDNVMVTAITTCAAIACGWFAARTRGWERRWRVLAATALAANATGQGVWAGYGPAERSDPAVPSWPDVAWLVTALVVICGLAVITRHATAGQPHRDSRTEVRLVLDSLLVSGSLFLLAWMTALGAASARSVLVFWVPAAEVVLITQVVLIYTTRRIPRENLRHLSLIGAGLVANSLSDITFSMYLNGTIARYPLVASAGYLAGALLVVRAVAMPDFHPVRRVAHQAPQEATWLSTVTPLLPLTLVTLFLAGKVMSGAILSTVEATGAVSIFALVILRQAVAFYRPHSPEQVPESSVTIPDQPSPDDSELDRKLRAHILVLSNELQRSSNRTAVWTFVGGAVLGVLGNVVVAAFMN